MNGAVQQDTGVEAGGGVTRFTNADARQALAPLKGSAILGEGKVCVVGLEAIREQMGPRWPARRAMVFEHFERSLRRQVGAHGFYLRISETDYLVSQPEVSRLAGQAYCLNCLRELLHYFLGEAQITQIRVHEIHAIGDGEVSGRKLDVAAVEEAEISERASAPAGAAPRPLSQDRWTPFIASDGRRVRASCQLEPVFQLRTFARIGYRMDRRVLLMPGDTPLTAAEHRNLSRTDVERIDFATLSRGLNRLQQDAGRALQPSLILPVSFVTLSNQRGRAVLADFFRAAQESVQQGLICEVCDIEGVPPGALLAATSLMRPFCRFVVGRLAEVPATPLDVWRDTGLHGFSIERPSATSTDAEFAAFAKSLLAATRPVAKTVMIYRLAGARQAAVAEFLGVTHASFTAPAKAGAPGQVLETVA